jgi:hypothetical protein
MRSSKSSRDNEVFVQAHDDPVVAGLGERPPRMASRLVKYKPEGACKPGLQCVDANFTITLPAMPITHRETRSRHPDGQEKTAASPQFLVVEITAMLARFAAGQRIGCLRHRADRIRA